MMYHIHFDNRTITICPKSENFDFPPSAVVYYPGDDSDLAELALIFDIDKKMPNLFIPTDDVEEAFRIFCSPFTVINAAGGVVKNGNNEYLMIFRKNLWDLPKGMQEDGEDIETTAVREVEEECGITRPELKDYICTTHHTFHRDGKFILKHTHWYNMISDSAINPKPQTEEEITEAVWMSEEQVRKCLENTYPSIREVFSKIGISVSR